MGELSFNNGENDSSGEKRQLIPIIFIDGKCVFILQYSFSKTTRFAFSHFMQNRDRKHSATFRPIPIQECCSLTWIHMVWLDHQGGA